MQSIRKIDTGGSRENDDRAETTAEAEEPEIPYLEAADSFAGGSGTEEDPYQIATAEQIALMGKVNDDWSQEYNKAYYVLTADIQLNDVENYETGKRLHRNISGNRLAILLREVLMVMGM